MAVSVRLDERPRSTSRTESGASPLASSNARSVPKRILSSALISSLWDGFANSHSPLGRESHFRDANAQI